MPGLLITLPIATLIALGFLAFFLWSVRNGDYEDPEMIKYRMVYDEDDDADRNISEAESGTEAKAREEATASPDAKVASTHAKEESPRGETARA